MRFALAQLMRIAGIQRLRAGLHSNYAGLGVVLDLLDRIDEHETALAPPGRWPEIRSGAVSRLVSSS
ncbi:hypothetical protein [Streptomyces mirabilis]|uniref:hypothetical protein n=1 Tax=Streptomyces mirabilis TaxID=68239 RepID=UPI0036C045EA